MYYYYNDFFPFHAFGFVFMILFWALVIYGIISLLKSVGIQHKKNESKDEPLEILKIRYAKGEITKEQFEEMKKHLK